MFLRMKSTRYDYINVALWGLGLWLILMIPFSETRLDEEFNKYSEPPATPQPPHIQYMKRDKCFHMPREKCPDGPTKCTKVGEQSVFCCDVDSFTLKEGLNAAQMMNRSNLHVLNPNLKELDISLGVFRRLTSMAVTDGNIGKIVGQFPKHSSIACLNISNNNLTSAKLQPSKHRPFAYLFNLSILDASANNLTEFPLSLVQSNRKISVDLSGNNYIPCKDFQRVMDSNNDSLVTFDNAKNTFCAMDLAFNWFKEMQIVQLEYVRVQSELMASCRNIKPLGINCSCVPDLVTLSQTSTNAVTNLVAVDCSQRRLKELPTNLPPNTISLNVSYNNITSLGAVGEDPTYEPLSYLIADYNDIPNVIELEGTKFIDTFKLLSIRHNKLKTLHTYVLLNRAENYPFTLMMSGNYIYCDCNAEKTLKPWILEYYKNIQDYKSIECQDGAGAVVELQEAAVCHTPRDWTDYIYYVIALEALTLLLLVSKVSYDYWVFKTAGYLPWPANKMPRLPCDWLCE